MQQLGIRKEKKSKDKKKVKKRRKEKVRRIRTAAVVSQVQILTPSHRS